MNKCREHNISLEKGILGSAKCRKCCIEQLEEAKIRLKEILEKKVGK